MITAACTAPMHLNAIKIQKASAKKPPIGFSCLNVGSNNYPITAGGIINGKCTVRYLKSVYPKICPLPKEEQHKWQEVS